MSTRAVQGNGLNAVYNDTLHCLAAEPDATFLKVSVIDTSSLAKSAQDEVAFETAVLGRLRRGYRVLQLRDLLGVRIELCYLFLCVSFGDEPNLWNSARQVRLCACALVRHRNA